MDALENIPADTDSVSQFCCGEQTMRESIATLASCISCKQA